MRLKLTYRRQGGKAVDILVTCDAAAKVSDVAEFLVVADPFGPPPGRSGLPTLAIQDRQTRVLDPRALVAESGIRSGDCVGVVRGAYAAPQRESAAATLRVVTGPDRGKEFPLRRGSNLIGRTNDCLVVLTDPMVSREHARINVSEDIEVIDLASANGVTVGGASVERAVLKSGDQVTLGDTSFVVRLQQTTGAGIDGASTPFIRSPRLAPVYVGRKFVVPELPERPPRQPFPLLTILAPAIMGVALYFVTRDVNSLLFIAFSPILAIGSWLEQWFAGRKVSKTARKAFDADLATMIEEADADRAHEVRSRWAESPGVQECLNAAQTLSSLLWCRRPDAPGFAEFRLGLGEQPSRSTLELPQANRAPRDLLAEVHASVARLALVDPVPVNVSPAQVGGVGFAGPRSLALSCARAVLVQAAALHSPSDLQIAAVASSRTSSDWEWLKWLPHCTPSASFTSGKHLVSLGPSASALVGDLEALIERRAGAGGHANAGNAATRLPVVLLLVESDAPVEFARLVDIAERGWRHGVYVVWVAPATNFLPASCRIVVEATERAAGAVWYLREGTQVAPVDVEVCGADEAVAFAQRVSPLVDLASRSQDASDLPGSVNLLSLLGPELASEPNSVLERWLQNRSVLSGPKAPAELPKKTGNLRAIVGQSAAGIHSLDLRTDGPHALVGGTTGSGKSELLQTWILSMAVSHSPQRLNFLLVDYKGGSAFADCERLPHTVGQVTDLNPNGVRRALTSLGAELRYREHLLARFTAKDLQTLEKSHPGEAPPSLVIVVDEFAALVTEVPEFVDGVVNVAQRGRSLGLHLILATQRPAGVIKDNLRANTNLRLALRMADVEDSSDVLGSPDAAYFDASLPGRSVSKTGPGRLVPFQSGYVGGHTGALAERAEVAVRTLGFGQTQAWEEPEDHVTVGDPGPVDIVRVVNTAVAAFEVTELAPPRKPWLPDLLPRYNLAELSTRRRDSELVFGVRDDPDNQDQPTVAYYPDLAGNLAVFGTGGSGKSTFLRTLAVAAGFTVRGGPCHVYGLDFSSRGLAMLEVLPHVGSVVNGSDDERVRRLLRWLRETIDERAARYAVVNAASIAEYRTIAGAATEPRILLLVDGIAAFRQAYEVSQRYVLFDLFTSIVADGRAVGVHVALSSDQRSGLTTALASSIQQAVVLRMAQDDDYSMLGVPKNMLNADSPPGRGVVDGSEVQIAVLGSAADASSQARSLNGFAASMVRAGVAPAPAIRRLPEEIGLSALPAAPLGSFNLGMESDRFDAARLAASGLFLLSGPPGSGRSTALRTMLTGLRGCGTVGSLHLFTDRKADLAAEPGWASVVLGADQFSEGLTFAVEELRALSVDAPRRGYFIEGLPDFANAYAEAELAELIRVATSEGHFVLAEGEILALKSSYGLIAPFKAARRGLILQPEDADGDLLQADLPRCKRADFVAGRGYLIQGGRIQMVQVAQCK